MYKRGKKKLPLKLRNVLKNGLNNKFLLYEKTIVKIKD